MKSKEADLSREKIRVRKSSMTNTQSLQNNGVSNKRPDLIEQLQKIINAQYSEADWTLLGYGDFMLCPEYARHRLTPKDWSWNMAALKAKAQDQCFRLPACSNAVMSTLWAAHP